LFAIYKKYLYKNSLSESKKIGAFACFNLCPVLGKSGQIEETNFEKGLKGIIQMDA